jgi:hypothetical protein
MSGRQSRKKGSAEDLLWVIVIYCDYERLYKEWSINPTANPNPFSEVTPTRYNMEYRMMQSAPQTT